MNTRSINSLFTLLLISSLISVSAIEVNAQSSNAYGFDIKKTGSGDPILFFPGLISSGEVWDETVQIFSEDYQCHVFTMPGYAGVPPVEADSYLDRWKAGILEYIEMKKLDNVTLVGHSLGGFLSLWIATENHPAVKQVIVVDALPFFAGLMNPNAQPGFNEETATNYMNSFSNMSEEQQSSARGMMARGMTSNSDKWETLAQWALDSDLKTEAWSATEMMGIDLRDEISNIEIPVLVLGAFQENPQFPNYTLEDMKHAYKTQYQNLNSLQFEVAEGAGHFIMFDKPAWMHQEMSTFMNSRTN